MITSITSDIGTKNFHMYIHKSHYSVYIRSDRHRSSRFSINIKIIIFDKTPQSRCVCFAGLHDKIVVMAIGVTLQIILRSKHNSIYRFFLQLFDYLLVLFLFQNPSRVTLCFRSRDPDRSDIFDILFVIFLYTSIIQH